MNQYVDLYDVYYLTLLVDRTASSLRSTRRQRREDRSIPSRSTHATSRTKWFQDAMAGKFLRVEGPEISPAPSSKTLYVDDRMSQKIFGDEGLALGSRAPVRNAEGEVIAVWKNVAKFASSRKSFRQLMADLEVTRTGIGRNHAAGQEGQRHRRLRSDDARHGGLFAT